MIGHLSSDSGIALVVPGYFVCAGILLYTAITAAILATHPKGRALHLAFAASSCFSAALTFSLASYYLADSVAGGLEALRWSTVASVLFMLSMFVFVGIYTESRNMLRVYAALALLSFVVIAAAFALPYGARYSTVESHGWTLMPWGESLFRLDGPLSAWNVAYRAAMVPMLGWGVWRLVQLHRETGRRDAAVLAGFLLLLFVASFQGSLVDAGTLRGFHTSPMALVGLALLLSVSLGMQVRAQNAELQQAANELRGENERRREAEARIRERAFTDPLTGLPNRLFLQERLGSLIEMGAVGGFGATLCCDLDHFKVVNDALSHEVGDELLREIASRLRDTASGEALVARTGGDQFMLVLDDVHVTEDEARARIEGLAAEVMRSLWRPLGNGRRSFNLSASIGVATFPTRCGTATEAIAHAEMALQRAKKRGRNNIQAFVPALRREASERFGVVEGLRHAIESGELTLHYQPQVDQHGTLLGAEALMRWNSRTRGPVPPTTFIPIAEETGLIHELGEWSLREGCRRLARWRREGIAFGGHLSVNVSPWQLARPEFVDRLAEIVHEHAVDPRSLTLEITESAVLFDVHETVAKLREIRPTGVRIALDDFGTGYSSLALIKDLPLDAIKIDQSFVRHLHEGANRHLVRVVVAIGAELEIAVVAEGVESRADRDALVALGCSQFQGYFFARPMAEGLFLEWLRARDTQERLAKDLSI